MPRIISVRGEAVLNDSTLDDTGNRVSSACRFSHHVFRVKDFSELINTLLTRYGHVRNLLLEL